MAARDDHLVILVAAAVVLAGALGLGAVLILGFERPEPFPRPFVARPTTTSTTVAVTTTRRHLGAVDAG